jgi:hypothetical protein
MRVDVYSSGITVPTSYQLDIYKNGQLIQTKYDYALGVSIG